MSATIRDTGTDLARTLRLSITGDCNLSCFYCKPLGKTKDLFQPKMPVQPSDVTKLVRILGEMGVTKIFVAGGEPLLRKDAPNFIKAAFAHKAIQDVVLVTNGTYLKAYADQLRKNGLRKVEVNFDTLNFKKYHALTKRDDLFRVIDGIDKVEKLNYQDIRINVQLLPGINHDEMINFALMTKERNVHVRFMEYTPVVANGDPLADQPKLSILTVKRQIDNFQRLFQTHDFESDETRARFKFADGVGQISFLSNVEVEQEKSVPRVLFNAEGVLSNELVPNRPQAILSELRRDAKQDRLRRSIEKVLLFHSQAEKAAKAKKAKAARPARTRAARPRRAAARR